MELPDLELPDLEMDDKMKAGEQPETGGLTLPSLDETKPDEAKTEEEDPADEDK
ncbi:MAG: hypothetical protein AAFY58_06585 [Planctomycetota bacterium]